MLNECNRFTTRYFIQLQRKLNCKHSQKYVPCCPSMIYIQPENQIRLYIINSPCGMFKIEVSPKDGDTSSSKESSYVTQIDLFYHHSSSAKISS